MYDRKPNCSYNCLIGMALKSSESGRLPVGEIYRFFEREFPYFLSAAEPWKNSLRHSLSLGHYFRKYNSDKLVTKKGHLWEVNPQRAAELDKEMYMFLARGIPENVPSSPQLSKLRLQMTQLLLDSIKTPPCSRSNSNSGSSSSNSHQQHHHHSTMYRLGHLQPARMGYTPQQAQQGMSQAFMIAPPAPIFSGDAQGSMMYSPTPNTGIGCLLSSTPTRQPPQLPFTPQAIYSIAAEAPLPQSVEGFNQHNPCERQAADYSTKSTNELMYNDDETGHMVQFNSDDQCFFGLEDGILHDLAVAEAQNDSTINITLSQSAADAPPTSEQKTSSSFLSSLKSSYPTEYQWKDCYYPFINPPTEESDVALAQLNGYHAWLDPGLPPELTITKCKPKQKTAAAKEVKIMDDAVRPIIHDWNAHWEMEEIICVLNEEAFMNCTEFWGEEDINQVLADSQENRLSREQSLDVDIPSSSVMVTPTISNRTATNVVKRPFSSTSGRRRPYRVRRGYSSARKWRLQRHSIPHGLKRSSGKKASSKPCGSSSLSTTTKKAKPVKEEAEEMIVSIPFYKLVTERQKKKYCASGGKYRIPTK